MTEKPDVPPVGLCEDLGNGVRRILAPNPSPMTYHGTNTYLLGEKDVAVIDPGPSNQDHMYSILRALKPRQKITHIFVTHSHIDHSPLAAQLSQETGASVLAFGPSGAGRSEIMQELATAGLEDGGEGIDAGFVPDVTVADGEVISGETWSVKAYWTPGHLGNHLCYAFGNVVFTGDLVMGWASSLVSPPDGDLTDFMASCRRLKSLNAKVFHAGHGAPIEDPSARLDWLIEHRESREASILKALGNGPATAAALAQAIYTDTPDALIPAATRNVLAHLIDLFGRSFVEPTGRLSEHATFRLI